MVVEIIPGNLRDRLIQFGCTMLDCRFGTTDVLSFAVIQTESFVVLLRFADARTTIRYGYQSVTLTLSLIREEWCNTIAVLEFCCYGSPKVLFIRESNFLDGLKSETASRAVIELEDLMQRLVTFLGLQELE